MKTQSEIAEAFRELCREHGIAATHQRQIIYQSILASSDHPTPELIYDRVREQLQSISLATVYKCLHTFLELGLVKPASIHYGSIRIDPHPGPHHHLVCRVCGNMTDVGESEIVSFPGPSKLPRGFRIEEARADFIGTCANCPPREKVTEKASRSSF
jgi:Fur family peroxide stress response transcriptional regulator